MKKELIIFDLDGTLIDSGDDIAWAANRTLKAMGYGQQETAAIRDCIGWGVHHLMRQLMPDANEGRIEEAGVTFLRFYGAHLDVDTAPYEGVMETLSAFRTGGKIMAVVTNKPVSLTLAILDGLGMTPVFKEVLGGDSVANKKPHPEPILKVLATLGISPDAAVLVGDSPIDCESARRAGIDVIGAAYGFRGREELEEAGCEVIIESFAKLKDIIKTS